MKLLTIIAFGATVIVVGLLVAILYLDNNHGSVPNDSTEVTSKLIALNNTLKELRIELRKMELEAKKGKTKLDDKLLAPSSTSSKQKFIASIRPELTSLSNAPSQIPRPVRYRTWKAILFTMDSMKAYEENSKRGGAAGEIIIRKSLERALGQLNVALTICRSDAEFEKIDASKFDFIILDPWTWAAKGWVPKPVIRGSLEKLYILDFFGSKALRGNSLPLSPQRILTAFGSPWNVFLGYAIDPPAQLQQSTRQNIGIIWGKDPKHFEGRENMLRRLSERVKLVATTTKVFDGGNIEWRGHQSKENWHNLLSTAKFLVGLGNPLLGPSAIDAVSRGCVYINPIYNEPMREVFRNQHPYAAEKIGTPYVCSYRIDSFEELSSCAETAMASNLSPMIPSDFLWENYLSRVKSIFHI